MIEVPCSADGPAKICFQLSTIDLCTKVRSFVHFGRKSALFFYMKNIYLIFSPSILNYYIEG